MSSYPIIADWTTFTEDLAANTLRTDNSWNILSPSLAAFRNLDDTQAEILREMDPTIAVADALDLCGSRIGETRGGLLDDEYRRIILGRQAASVANGTAAGIWAMWLAVTGARADQARMLRWGAPDKPLVWLWATVDSAPSVTFLRRAGAVVRDAVAFPMDVLAGIGLPSILLTDGLPGLDVAPVLFSMETSR